MKKIFNHMYYTERRKELRRNMTKAEVILWSKIRNRQGNGYKFRRQHGIEHFTVDFYCPELKLAIEVDGDSHYEDGAEQEDEKRQQYIEQYGITFLRFTNDDIYHHLESVLQAIWNRTAEKH